MNSIFGYLFSKNEYQTLYVVICLSSISIIISAFEWFALKQHLMSNGIFSWTIRSLSIKNKLQKKYINLLFNYPNLLSLYVIQILAGITIFFSKNHPISISICCGIISLISITLNFRTKEGLYGADKMSRLILITGALCFIFPTLKIIFFGLYFISFQLILSYGTAGWIRLFQPKWRDGSDLKLVLRQHTYSNKIIWRLIENNRFPLKSTAILILVFECSFVISLFLPTPFFFIYIIFGIIFHLTNAIVMGLNTFVWSFLSAYPAIIWLHYTIQQNFA